MLPSICTLSRDPNLSRKPPETQGNGFGFRKERWLERMGNQPLEKPTKDMLKCACTAKLAAFVNVSRTHATPIMDIGYTWS